MADPHEREYLGAVAGMADTYGLPRTHYLEVDGKAVVFWVDGNGHLRNGPVLTANSETVVAAMTKGAAILLPREALKPVPRFFGGGA